MNDKEKQLDYEERCKKCGAEVEVVLKKYELGLVAITQLVNQKKYSDIILPKNEIISPFKK